MSSRPSLFGSPVCVGIGNQQEESPTSVVDHPPPADNPPVKGVVPPRKYFERRGKPFILGDLKLQLLRYNPTAESIRDYPDFRTLDMVYNNNNTYNRQPPPQRHAAAPPQTRQQSRPPTQPRILRNNKRPATHLDNLEDQFAEDLVDQSQRRSQSSNSSRSGSSSSSSSGSRSLQSQPRQVTQRPPSQITPQQQRGGSNDSHSSLSHPFQEDEEQQQFELVDQYDQEDDEHFEEAQQYQEDPHQEPAYDQYQGNYEQRQSQAEDDASSPVKVVNVMTQATAGDGGKALRNKRAALLAALKACDAECVQEGIPALQTGNLGEMPNPQLEATKLHAQIQQHKRRRSSNGQPTDTEKERIRDIDKAIKEKGIWRVCKFIVSDQGSRILAKNVITLNTWVGYIGDDPAAVKNREDFVEAFHGLCLVRFNKHRTYVNGRIKSACHNWWSNNKNTLPLVKDLERCLKRTLIFTDTEDDPEKNLFYWYWNDLLYKASGCKADWHEKHRYYMTISKAAPPNEPNKVFITPSTEAYAVACFASNRERWLKMFSIKKQHPAYKQIVLYKYPDKYDATKNHAVKGDSQEIKAIVKDPKDDSIYLFGKSYPPDYSVVNGGQMFATGLTKTGYFAMNNYAKDNKEARAKKDSEEVETKMLALIKQHKGIKHATWEEEDAAKRAGNMHQDAAAAEALPEMAFDYELI